MVYDLHIFVCTNQRTAGERRSCGEQHGLAVVAEFKKLLKGSSVKLNVRANRSGCLGICDFGQTVAVYPDGTFYVGVSVADVAEIVESHVMNGRVVERLLLKKD